MKWCAAILVVDLAGFGYAMAKYLMTGTDVPTPAATCNGVRFRQSLALGESGQILMISATIPRGGVFLTTACKNDMPLNSLLLDIMSDRAVKALGLCKAISLNVDQS